MSSTSERTSTGWIWKIAMITIAYFLGTMISGAVITAAGMAWPTLPEPTSDSANLVIGMISSLLMAGCLALLARGIGGSRAARWLVLASFTYVVFGLNNQIEAAVFTTYGGTETMLLFFIAPCALAAAAAVWLIPAPSTGGQQETVAGRRLSLSWWRVVIAWLAFPAIYIFFGMLVSPIVVPFYQQPDFGLTIPGWSTLLPVVLLRSALCLAVTLPILVLWSLSRRSLLATLAIVLFAFIGLIGLATAYFFPPTLRIFHSLEILGDAVVYAWVLVALFVRKESIASTVQTDVTTVSG